MRFSAGRFLLEALVIALPALAVAPLMFAGGPAVDAVREGVFDSFQRLSPRPYDPASPVRILDIDEESLRRLGQWPWPRDVLADAVSKLAEAGAAAVSLDLVLAEPDRTSPERLLRELPEGPEKARVAELVAGRSHDDRLAAALAGAHSALGVALVNDSDNAPTVKAAFATSGDEPSQFLYRFSGAVDPLPPLAAAATGVGAVNWAPDRDLIVRRVQLLFAVGQRIAPALALETLRVTQDASTIMVKASNASGEQAFGGHSGVNSVRVGELTFATDRDSSLRIRYAGSRPERVLPFWRLAAGELAPEEVRGRIVLVGSSASALSDIRSTPAQSSVPGVEIHAELLEQMVAGVSLVRPDYAPGLELALAALGALLAGALARLVAPAPAAAIVAAGLAAMAVGSWLAFDRMGLLIDAVAPALATLGVYITATVLRVLQSDGERRRIRAAFAHYVAPEVVRAIAADPSRLKLGGETKPLTVLFSDLRDFTARSEDMPAESVIRLLNLLHTPLTEAVLAERGTVDKYIGDGLMAFWNAPLDLPDHVERACRTALAMQRRLPEIERRLAQEIGPEAAARGPLELGIGIGTGMACVGNMGSALRFDYSTVGDTVNTAARLEPLTRVYGVPILVSEPVALAARGFAFVPIDTVLLKGKARSTRVYALHGRLEDCRPDFGAFLAEHEAALEAVMGRELRARRLLARLRARPEAAAYGRVYDEWERRLDRRAAHPAEARA